MMLGWTMARLEAERDADAALTRKRSTRRATFRLFLAALACTLALPYGAHGAQERRHRVFLNALAKQLLDDVERLYGRGVNVVGEQTRAGVLGKAQVRKDGTPVVVIKPHIEEPATTLVHELFHLRDRYYGIPSRIRPDELRLFRGEVSVRELEDLFAMVRDRIAHRMFYSDMRAMGYSPTAAYVKALPRQIAQFRDTRAPRTRIRRTIMLLQAELEGEDEVLVDILKRELVRAGAAPQVSQAEELAQFIRENKPSTTGEFIGVFLAVTNRILSEEGVRLEALPIRWDPRGQLKDPVVLVRAINF